MGIYGKTAPSIDVRAVSEEMQPVIEDWFNAEIQIIDPHIDGGAFNRVTNTKTRVAPDILWQGPARIQAVRWPNVATSRHEALSTRTVVFQIPISADIDSGLIQEGYRVTVIDGGMTPEFEDGLFVITTTINSSYAWNRRIETMMDQGAVVG